MTRLAFLALLLAASVPAATAQGLRGRVTDAETGEPVPSAHVFVDGTAIGDVTEPDGTFALRLPPFLPFRLVVSMIGYDTVETEVRTAEEAGLVREIRLAPSLLALDEFVVEAEQPRAWRRHLAMLKEILFSTTEGGLRCRFLNPEMLELDERDGRLTAAAPVPVQIENPWLGYRITLHRFRFSGTHRLFRWTGRIQFEDMADDQTRERFERRRKTAFRGSMRHFLRALATDRVPKEGFDAGLVDAPGSVRGVDPVLESGRSAASGATRIAFGDAHADSRSILFPRTLLVRFVGAVEPAEYARHMREIAPDTPLSAGRDNVQSSWLQLPYGMAIVDTLGNVITDGSTFPVTSYGYWSWQRMGDMLPADWLPR